MKMHPYALSVSRAFLTMFSTKASAANSACARMPLVRVVSCVSLLSLAAIVDDAAAATPGKTYFFATRDACAASGAFSPRECAAAFANARAQLQDRAPRFAGSGECRLHYRICEPIRVETPSEDAMSYAPAEEVSFAPSALGVEIVASSNGVEAAPTLAVETRERLFPYYPVSKPYEAQQEGASVQARDESGEKRSRREQQNAAILSPDHFEPFSRRNPIAGATTFTASALGAIQSAAGDPRDESREARRMRLRNAPFVE
jgi:hypothetical protein